MTESHSPVRRMSALAEQIEPVSTKAVEKKIASQEHRAASIKGVLPYLLPVENKVKQRLEAEAEQLGKEITAQKKHLKKSEALNHLRSQYRRLSMDPLRWRDDQGLPLFVIYHLFADKHMPDYARFSCSLGDDYRVRYGHPRPVEACYGDLERLLKQRQKPGRYIELKCEFDGIIPLEARKKMNDAVKDFKEGDYGRTYIYLIAEPSTWEWEEGPIVREVDPDPLIVGWSELDPEALWLIAAFDVTTVEQLMLSMVSE